MNIEGNDDFNSKYYKTKCKKQSYPNVKKHKSITKDFNYIDKLFIPQNNPAIKKIKEINIKTFNVKTQLLSSCDANFVIKGYKVIKMSYESLSCSGRTITSSYITPFFEILPINYCSNIINMANQICFSCADLANRRLVYIYTILSIKADIEYSSCNLLPICKPYDNSLVKCSIDNKSFDNTFEYEPDFNFKNDFL